MKKLFALLLALVLVFCFTACDNDEGKAKVPSIYDVQLTKPFDIETVKEEDLKIGLIISGNSNLEHDIKNTLSMLGLSTDLLTVKTSVAENEDAFDAVCELAELGCKFIVASSIGYEEYIIKAAEEYKNVHFCTIGGQRAKTELVGNYHTAYINVYEGRYVSGVAAGLKFNELIKSGTITEEDAKLGFVAEFNNSESVSAFTAFYLGAKSVCPTAVIDVKFTEKRLDSELENQATEALISDGCRIISNHTFTSAVADTCEANGTFSVPYGVASTDGYKSSAIITLNTSFEGYFNFAFVNMLNGSPISSDYCSTADEGAYYLSEINGNVAAKGTELYVKNAKAKLLNNKLSVFDIKSFTVNGGELNSYFADIVFDKERVRDTEAIANGCFNESTMRSAPYFDIIIDGVNIKK